MTARDPKSAAFLPPAPESGATGTVAILLGVYNGRLFLEDQIRSLEQQIHPSIDIWASDDGSSDGSLALLEQAAGTWSKGQFHILKGPGKGFAENFRSLIVNPAINAEFFAFCDQDDMWDHDKLSAAVSWLSEQDPNRPALYCSRTRNVDEAGRYLSMSPLFPKPPSFRNAIVQSIAGANTMVMNRAAWTLLAEGSRRTPFVSHDWWAYLLVSGAGGVVRYSPNARIGYRQHETNLVGSNSSLAGRLSRYTFLYKGGFAEWTSRNIAGLRACRNLLSPEALVIMERIEGLRGRSLPARLVEIRRTGVYRQTLFGHIGLYLASIINKL
jgi:glycosyltransferase involved in cell wall biosynthesis